jgi:CheY-like chemotaxis protein
MTGLPDQTRLKVMMLEDNPSDVILLKLAFSELGVSCNWNVFSDGDQLLAFLAGTNADSAPDLLIVDLNLPKMDGGEVTAKLNGPGSTNVQIPVVIFTGCLPRCKTGIFGAQLWLEKPSELDGWVDIARQMLAVTTRATPTNPTRYKFCRVAA